MNLPSLQDCTPEQLRSIGDVLSAVEWGAMQSPQEAPLQNCRIIRPSLLHRSSHFKNDNKTRVDKTLEVLIKCGIAHQWLESPKGEKSSEVVLDSWFIPNESRSAEDIAKALCVLMKVYFNSLPVESEPQLATPPVNTELEARVAELEQRLAELAPKPVPAPIAAPVIVPPAPPLPAALNAEYDFMIPCNGQLLKFHASDPPITEKAMIAFLIRSKAPVYAADAAPSGNRCPHCGIVNPSPLMNQGKHLIPIRDFDCFFPVGVGITCFIHFYKNDVISDPLHVNYFLGEGMSQATKIAVYDPIPPKPRDFRNVGTSGGAYGRWVDQMLDEQAKNFNVVTDHSKEPVPREIIDGPRQGIRAEGAGKCYPTKEIKSHEFIRCAHCHKCFFDNIVPAKSELVS